MCRFRIPTVLGRIRTSVLFLLCLSLGLAAAMAQPPTADKDQFEAAAFGAKADGKSDDTAAIQKALDAAGKRGGAVRLPAGRYLVAGSLNIPVGVSLVGSLNVPVGVSFVGSHQAPVSTKPLVGTVILATGGRDNEDAPALFELGNSSAVIGLTVFYPDQKPDHVRPYAWTFHLQGSDNTVENVTLINAYNGIKIGPEYNQRHRIRSVVGCVLRRGIWVDNCYDIGRIENVHWSSDWWSSKQVGGWDNTPVGGGRLDEYLWKHLVGFTFGRADWEYVTNTYILSAKIGYHFIGTKNGAMMGQLSGIAVDGCQRCIVVDGLFSPGLLITNGQFSANWGENPISVVINPTCTGQVRFQNCAFFGPATQNVVSHGQGFVSLSNCWFRADQLGPPPIALGASAPPESRWFKADRPDHPPLIEADNGKIQIEGCTFAVPGPSILLGKGLKHAIVTGNNGVKGVTITNRIGDRAIIANNEPSQ